MIFLGLLFDKEEETQIAKKSRGGVVQNQVNTFQWNCIEGFYENSVNNLKIINALPVGTYPKYYRDLIIHSKRWKYRDGQHYQTGFINLPVFKQIGNYLFCKRLLKKLNDKNIIIYSAYQPFLKAIKKLDKSFNVTLIVPDLPEYYDYAQVNKIKKIMRKINNYSIRNCMKRVNSFVLLTEAMKEPLQVENRPFVVVEGICSASKSPYVRSKQNDKKIILYTGALVKKFGISILLDAFNKIDNEDYELWICGGGEYTDAVKTAAKQDDRIKFYGYVSKEEILKLQEKATILVNPRQNIGEYTKYSFPSKIMEYLMSGVPVVAYKLDGIPDEYSKYITYVSDNTSQSLKNVLLEVCEDSTGHYERMAKQARNFILSKKNSQKQVEKIIDLMGMRESMLVREKGDKSWD